MVASVLFLSAYLLSPPLWNTNEPPRLAGKSDLHAVIPRIRALALESVSWEGMTEARVIQLLGNPASRCVTCSGSGLNATFAYPEHRMTISLASDGKNVLRVQRVVFYPILDK